MMSRSKTFRRIRRLLLLAPLVVVALLLTITAAFAISNLGLPDASLTVERLHEAEKARLAETFHLRESLGELIWPGWGEADIPIVVFNEAYVFLVGAQNPQDGWEKVPNGPKRGGPWELVPGDDFYGQPYYRQTLPAPEITPEAFTVRIGDQWAASLQTKEWMEIALRETIKRDLPGFLQAIVPYRLVVPLLMRGSDGYIASLLHESFHAFQGLQAPDHLSRAEDTAATLSGGYPYEDEAFQEAWQIELDLLADALEAETTGDSARLAAEFLAARNARRTQSRLAGALVDFERQREWLEGTARFVELAVWREGAAEGYSPLEDASPLSDYKAYADYKTRWNNEVDQTRRMARSSGDGRFYYSGMAQAELLERLLPDWKEFVVPAGAYLEDLLASVLEHGAFK
jgi:hypothetical protein